MSMALLKKSMAIVEEDIQATKKSKSKETTVKKKGFKPNKFKYEEEPAIKKSVVKQTLENIRNEMESSSQRAEENVNKLLSFSKHAAKIKNADKILQRAHNGKYVVEKPKPVEEQESIFTEEDFANFEKELAAQTI